MNLDAANTPATGSDSSSGSSSGSSDDTATRPVLTHTDASGSASMVDVGHKPITRRSASAEGCIRMLPATLRAIRDNQIAKGDVLTVARIAGTMAAKRTADLIPLCHPIPIAHVNIELELDDALPGIRARVSASTTGQTGIEMETIVATSIALATIYDMAKSADRGMVIGDVRLVSKAGGASGRYDRDPE